jgi:antitoxin component HigA of HigAB toxin-antitoxin module
MTKIQNKQDYYSVMAAIEGYLQKGFSNLSQKEEQHLDELSRVAEAWELSEYPMPMQPSFIDILNHIIQNLGINQSSLSEKLSVSKSHLSEILSGKKQPNIELVSKIYSVFGIDADILLQSVAHLFPINISKRSKSSRVSRRARPKTKKLATKYKKVTR